APAPLQDRARCWHARIAHPSCRIGARWRADAEVLVARELGSAPARTFGKATLGELLDPVGDPLPEVVLVRLRGSSPKTSAYRARSSPTVIWRSLWISSAIV